MQRPFYRTFRALGLPVVALLAPCLPALAADEAPAAPTVETPHFWRIVVSPYSLHFRPSEEHEHVYAVGVERQAADGWLLGGSFFSNSFGQPSAYVYFGKRYDGLFNRPQLFGQWSVGMMYGYVDPYEDKVPLNYNGFSPGALLSLGWQFNRTFSAQINTLGDAGLMLQLSFDLR